MYVIRLQGIIIIQFAHTIAPTKRVKFNCHNFAAIRDHTIPTQIGIERTIERDGVNIVTQYFLEQTKISCRAGWFASYDTQLHVCRNGIFIEVSSMPKITLYIYSTMQTTCLSGELHTRRGFHWQITWNSSVVRDENVLFFCEYLASAYAISAVSVAVSVVFVCVLLTCHWYTDYMFKSLPTRAQYLYDFAKESEIISHVIFTFSHWHLHFWYGKRTLAA